MSAIGLLAASCCRLPAALCAAVMLGCMPHMALPRSVLLAVTAAAARTPGAGSACGSPDRILPLLVLLQAMTPAAASLPGSSLRMLPRPVLLPTLTLATTEPAAASTPVNDSPAPAGGHAWSLVMVAGAPKPLHNCSAVQPAVPDGLCGSTGTPDAVPWIGFGNSRSSGTKANDLLLK